VDRLAIELDDDIAGHNPALCSGAVLREAADQRPHGILHAQAFREFVSDVLDADADPAAANLPELPQLGDNRDRDLGGNRETDADRPAGWRHDGRVDADDLAGNVEERSAGIAAIYGRVRLDVVVVRA
jgi:hypothetical protein